jgi:steroid delta-isomerase-like uncharacterized protein
MNDEQERNIPGDHNLSQLRERRDKMCKVLPVSRYFILVIALTFMLFSLPGCEREKMAQEEENKAVARLFWEEGWKQGNQTVFDQICAADFINHDPVVPQVTGLDSYKQHVALYAAAFPAEGGVEIEDMLAQGDKLAVRWTWRVIHEGEYMGISPTGNQLTMTGITFHRFSEGKVAENWHQYDALGFLQQLGVVPPMGREDFTWGQPAEAGTGVSCDLEVNKAVYRREAELWNQKNLDIADEIFATGFVNHDPSWPGVTDLESFKEWAAGWLSAAPDLEIVIEDIVAERELVAARWTCSWTDVAGMAGSQPTGKEIVVTGMDICRVAQGKITERWWAKDVLGAMQQLGVIPPLGEGGK